LKKLKFAIIGCGRISYKHVEGLIKNYDEAVLISVCDLIIENANMRKNEYENIIKDSKVKVYTDYKEMIEKENLDVVTIATESGYHPQIAIYCMEHGKNVICEKPMALSIEDADRMIEILNSTTRSMEYLFFIMTSPFLFL
jgi:predicted dehydrogenase